MADLVGQQFGNYRLLKCLGSGNFADVYLGEHVHLNTQAAIKVTLGKLSPLQEQKFREEARNIAKLVHPNIVRFLEYGIAQNGMPYIVMDYAPQGTLENRHPHGSILALTTIVTYVKQIADALQYVHDQKLVHRDIKPENLLVDKNGNILVTDFGIAVTAHGTGSLDTEDKIGTIHYMAPEQIRGKPRPASDQYSLGVLVYEWLCGKCPFDGNAAIEIALQHVSSPPPPFQKDLKISSQVEQVVMKALAKDPHDRFESAQKFAEALEQASIQTTKVAVKPAPLPIQPIPSPVPQPVTPKPYNQPQPKPIIPPKPIITLQPNKTTIHTTSRRKFLVGLGAAGVALGSYGLFRHNIESPGHTLYTYRGHSDQVNAAAWSPDGRRIASGSADQTVQVWDAMDGGNAFTYNGHSDQVLSVAWSSLGNQIASASADGTVQVWDASNGNKIIEYKGHNGWVLSIAWSPDGSQITSAGQDDTVQVWDVSTGSLVWKHFPPETYSWAAMYAVDWSPDAANIVSASEDGNVEVWEAATGNLIKTFKGGMGDRTDGTLVWSPDSKWVAVSTVESAQVWDAIAGQLILDHQDIVDNHYSTSRALAWSPNSTYIASGGDATVVQIWDAITSSVILNYNGHSSEIVTVAWSPDSKYIASGSKDNTVQVWRVV